MTPQDFTARFVDPWLSKLAISDRCVHPLFACVLGYRVNPTVNRGGGWQLGRLWFGRVSDEALFYNGIFSLRIMLPFYIGLSFRWAASDPIRREFIQTYAGWKLNGAFSVVFRIQSDSSAAAGFTSANPNQSFGWLDGPK